MDYDEEADVLYISLKRPQKATDTKFGVSASLPRQRPVGVTVLDASKPRKHREGLSRRSLLSINTRERFMCILVRLL
ncbi:MAG TPA: DUF2283 domain-containing protein [Candidatus Binatia bacterium]